MVFKVQAVNIDILSSTANVVAVDIDHQPPGVVNISFPFAPAGGGEGHTKEALIAAAKVALEQALNEI